MEQIMKAIPDEDVWGLEETESVCFQTRPLLSLGLGGRRTVVGR